MRDFSGVWTALITPMTENGVDYPALERIVDEQSKSGVSGIVAVGTTGESPTLSPEEHINVIKECIKFSGGRVPVIAGTGSNSTLEAIALTEEADAAGADGFLIVAPYYNKPSQEGVYLHFSEIARRTEKPIFLYSIPGRCGIEISNDTAVRLREKFENICVMKEAGGKVEKVADLNSKLGGKMAILSGDDALTLDFMKSGACGVVSVASNIIPGKMVEMVRLALDGQTEKALEISSNLNGFFKALFVEPNPVPAKFAMKLAGKIPNSFVRLPLCQMLPQNSERVRAEMERVGILK